MFKNHNGLKYHGLCLDVVKSFFLLCFSFKNLALLRTEATSFSQSVLNWLVGLYHYWYSWIAGHSVYTHQPNSTQFASWLGKGEKSAVGLFVSGERKIELDHILNLVTTIFSQILVVWGTFLNKRHIVCRDLA